MAAHALSVAVIGSGPAGLMAATLMAGSGLKVTIYERQPGPARKLFIAGSSGLNISNGMDIHGFAGQYQGASREYWQNLLVEFGVDAWLGFIHQLGISTFLGTSNRYFVETMHAGQLVRLWRRRLTELGVEFRFSEAWTDLRAGADGQVILDTDREAGQRFSAIALCVGGASYEPNEGLVAWMNLLRGKGISIRDFVPSNVGYEIDWTPAFLQEAEGMPIKNMILTTRRGSRRGDLVVTSYGIEGTPVYTVGAAGGAAIDLKPDMSLEQVRLRLGEVRENWSPVRRVQKLLNLSPAARSLVFHYATADARDDVAKMAELIKTFPIELRAPRPITEAISSAGGVAMNELDQHHMFHRIPGVFAAGEMLDWDAPTGGFLIQACVSQGARMGRGILSYLGHGAAEGSEE
jgi:uncharacterized flavoprotein (TIGR03862 family)